MHIFVLAYDTAQLLIFVEANIAWLQMVSPRTDVACIDRFRYGANVILSCRTGILFCTECGGLKIVRADAALAIRLRETVCSRNTSIRWTFS